MARYGVASGRTQFRATQLNGVLRANSHTAPTRGKAPFSLGLSSDTIPLGSVGRRLRTRLKGVLLSRKEGKMAKVERYECDSCGNVKPITLTFVVRLVEEGPRKHLCRACAIGLANYMRLLGIPFHFFDPDGDRLGRLALWVRPMALKGLPMLWPETEHAD